MFTSENNAPRSRIPDFPSYHPPTFSRITNNEAISIRVILSSNTRHCTPLECRRDGESCSIDISLLWSETILRRNAFSKPVIERKMSVTC